jgi:hypothetical protein
MAGALAVVIVYGMLRHKPTKIYDVDSWALTQAMRLGGDAPTKEA